MATGGTSAAMAIACATEPGGGESGVGSGVSGTVIGGGGVLAASVAATMSLPLGRRTPNEERSCATRS